MLIGIYSVCVGVGWVGYVGNLLHDSCCLSPFNKLCSTHQTISEFNTNGKLKTRCLPVTTPAAVIQEIRLNPNLHPPMAPSVASPGLTRVGHRIKGGKQ